MSRDVQRAQRVGRYHLLDRVAVGGMAEVYRAKLIEADGSEQLVALKRVLEMFAEDPAFLKMLIAEYRLSAFLKHPNIAAIYELLRTADGYYIAMEFVDGKDLRATLDKLEGTRYKLDVADAVYLMARALDGLHHAHTACTDEGHPLELVHRDFSPSNILLGYDGSVKLIDFGIAKAAVDRDRTAVGVIKGKVRYMSPEQANGDAALTGQSDVFAAGSVLYELLSHEPPFDGPNEIEVIYAVRRANPRPLRELVPTLPDGLGEIVRRAMAKSKRDRFTTAGEFRDALVTFLRAYAPGYRRTKIANLMRTIWSREIDREISSLLKFAIAQGPAMEAENLLESVSVEESLEATRSLNISDVGTETVRERKR